MIDYYNVYYEGQLVAHNVRAVSESDAVEQVYLKTGGASAYTGKALRLYTASRSYYREV